METFRPAFTFQSWCFLANPSHQDQGRAESSSPVRARPPSGQIPKCQARPGSAQTSHSRGPPPALIGQGQGPVHIAALTRKVTLCTMESLWCKVSLAVLGRLYEPGRGPGRASQVRGPTRSGPARANTSSSWLTRPRPSWIGLSTSQGQCLPTPTKTKA